MLARRSLARTATLPAAVGAAPSGARNMATLREIELRLKSVRNIEKITKVRPRNILNSSGYLLDFWQSMKMIASTKLAKAQRAMEAGKKYGLANKGSFEKIP